MAERAFWPISQEQDFSHLEDLFRKTANNINFHYRTSLGKINDHSFLYIQKTLFLVYFPNFGGQKKLSQKIKLSHTT